MAVAELEVRIKGNTGNLTSSFAKAEGQAKSFGATMSKVGSKMQSVGRIATIGVTAPIVAMGVASIKAASNLEESMSKVQQVFKDAAPSVLKFAKGAADSIGQSEQQALEAAGTFGNLFTAFGMGEKAAASMSTELVALASDLASFNNMNIDEVLVALRSGLTGEVEPLKRLGAAFNQAELEAKALAMGLISVGGEMSEADKIAARYALVLDKTKNSQGDFARTADGMANSVRTMNANFEDAKATLGEKFLPIATDVVKTLNKMLEKFEDLTPAQQDFALNMVKIAAVAGPAIFILGSMAKAIGALVALKGLGAVATGVGGVGTAAAGSAGGVAAFLKGLKGIGALLATGVVLKLLKDTADGFRNFMADVETDGVWKALAGDPEEQARATEAVGGMIGVLQDMSAKGKIAAEDIGTISFAMAAAAGDSETTAYRMEASFSAIALAAETGAGVAKKVIEDLASGTKNSVVETNLLTGKYGELSNQLGTFNTKAGETAVVMETASGRAEIFVATADGIKSINVDPLTANIGKLAKQLGLSKEETAALKKLIEGLKDKQVKITVTTVYESIGQPGGPTAAASGVTGDITGLTTNESGTAGLVPKKSSAAGNFLMKGQASWVGEAGRELFVPETAGEVIPTNKLKSSGSGRPIGGDGGSAGGIVVNVTVEGNVVTERDLISAIRQGLIQDTRRGNTPLEFSG